MIRSLWRDGAIYTLGTLATRGLGLLLLPLYTLALKPADFGLLDLIVTAGVLVNLLVPLETPQAMARFWNERAEGSARRRLAGTSLLFALAGYAVFAAVVALAADPLLAWFGGRPGDAGAVRAGAVYIAANGLLLVLQAQFRWALRPRAFVVAGAAYSVGVLGGLALLVFAGAASVASVLWVQAAAAGLVAAGCAWTLRGTIAPVIDRGELAAMLRFSLPLVPAGVAAFAMLHSYRFVLGAQAPLDEVGEFAVASRLASACTLLLVGVQSALTPLVYAHHAEPETPARLGRLLESFVALAVLACLALAAFAHELLAVLVAPGYTSAATLVAWLAPAAVLAQMYAFAPGIPLARKTLWQLWLTLASGALGLALAVGLVPGWQAAGAAAAACAAAAAFFVAWVLAGQRLYPLPARWGRLLVAAAVYAVAVGAVAWLDTAAAGLALWGAKLGICAGAALLLWALGLLRALPPREPSAAPALGH